MALEDAPKGYEIFTKKVDDCEKVVLRELPLSLPMVCIGFGALALPDQVGEFVDGQIGPLPRTVYGEITERHCVQLMKMRVSRAKKFAGNFCRSVRTECLS